ncbi:MAG TPA: (2Fe-2S)-binding protein [Verrucomicrobiae bacterium]|nr:(2Fe-2S)-binding protein [Verrucomicrobiae bacterium]
MANITKLHVNGKSVQIDADPERTLLSVLRDDLELTGAKYGCGEGECGACTVLLDGAPVRSCRRTMASIGEKKIETVESLEEKGKLHPVQKAFMTADAMQCGYCTCGMIMSAVALLRKTPKPTRDQIVRAMDGNLCRCCAYPRIIKAVEVAAKEAAQ